MKRLVVIGIVLVLVAVYSSIAIVKVNGATGASIVMSPDTTTSIGNIVLLNLTINDVTDMRAWNIGLVYQKIITLSLVDTINNTAFTDGPGLVIYKQEDYNSSCYYLNLARTTIDIVPGAGTGSGLVARLYFLAASNGKTAISPVNTETEILNSNTQEITPVTVTTPTITVAAPQPSPQPKPVGGNSYSVVKPAAFPAAYIGLALTAIFATTAIIATTIYFKGIKPRKEKQ